MNEFASSIDSGRTGAALYLIPHFGNFSQALGKMLIHPFQKVRPHLIGLYVRAVE